ncbi:hypothetical protein H0I25_01175 [Cellulophaga sp. HaHa_2_95]|uniref:hypothetical protein n=1 Tax=Cellulophaga sp. HaHa_2_95 TaxID=2745558 RepID=UPI001C4EC7A7|nr:hypothetical protein [Cellulophaga sp. HaHa_2_95]QXP56431.1 hypothetical protein H0I25_01175 [Cellulophaga sp. HaHa_2_95]
MEKFAIHLTVLKTYLVNNMDDFFILDQAKKITDLKLEAAKGRIFSGMLLHR